MRYLWTGCLLLWALCLSGQRGVDSLKVLEVGLGGGFWSTEVGFSPSVVQAPFTGAHAGLSLRYFDKKTVGFQAELNYDQAGWQEIQDSMDLYYRRSIDFVTLQLFTQVTVGNGRFRPLIQGGPYVSFPLSDQETIPTTFVVPSLERSYYEQAYPSRITYGLVFGAGFYFDLGQLAIQAEGRFLAGFSDLYRSGTTQVETSRRRSVGARMSVFYKL